MKNLIYPITLFAVALLLRIAFFQGFILGDDPQEFVTVLKGLTWHPWSDDQLYDRFGVWFLNYLSQRPFGTSEFTFFLPTLVLSSLLPVAAYFAFCCDHFADKPAAFLVGAFVATAPFEIFIGTVRANDTVLAGSLAGAFLAWQYRRGRPLLAGSLAGLFLWYGFFVKLWALYALPLLCLGFISDLRARRNLRFPLGFLLTSALLHFLTACSFHRQTGLFFPWLHFLPGNGVVPGNALPELFFDISDATVFRLPRVRHDTVWTCSLPVVVACGGCVTKTS